MNSIYKTLNKDDIAKLNILLAKSYVKNTYNNLGACMFAIANAKLILTGLKAEAKHFRTEIFETEKEIEKLFKEIDQINRSFDKEYKEYMRSPYAKAIREDQETRRLLKEIDAIDREYMRVYNEYNRSPCAAACRAEAQGNDCEARE